MALFIIIALLQLHNLFSWRITKLNNICILGKEPEAESIQELESIEQLPPLPLKSIPNNWYWNNAPSSTVHNINMLYVHMKTQFCSLSDSLYKQGTWL